MRLVPFTALGALILVGVATGADEKPVVVKLNKLSAPAPAGWKSEKPANRFRTYQFKLPGAKDHPEAELSVMNESLPGADKNFPKWKNTFAVPEGKTADDISKTAKWEVKGATVNVLDVTGTWKYKERPFDPKSKEMLLEDWRVIWVIVEEKDAKGEPLETHHLRLSGPSVTVAEHAKAFEDWVKAFK
ncbi:hypothetical protein R5W23_000600 [Gemmata sp. JC673]|uniref:SRPBCC family protein n=1 Tax=Gemmata algarum TaxID=2975278 RepID=A0ABU5EWP9_9BACT|nr:hypothetical protein [Gemmata algarum]MDY3559606.1 hypothetical protein [Gemmata algarum]